MVKGIASQILKKTIMLNLMERNYVLFIGGNMKERSNERSIGIDILRIMLAFMVLTLHFNGSTTGAVSQSVEFLPIKILVILFEALCYPAVNCYVIISGYFTYKKNKSLEEQFSSLTRLYLCVLAYSLVGYIISLLIGKEFIVTELISRFFPLTTGQWWYMSCYFALMILSPYVNKLIGEINAKQHKFLLCILITIFSIMPFFLKFQDHLGVNYGYSLIWFLTLYLTGAYFSKNGVNLRIKGKSFYLLSYLGLSVFMQCFSLFTSRVSVLNGFSLASYNSIVVYLQAISLVLFFLQSGFDIKNRKIRNMILKISALSMSLYLLHCQVDIEILLWDFLKPSSFCNSWMFIPLFISASIVLFIIGCLFECVRRYAMSLGNFENKIVHKVVGNTKKILNTLME